MTALPKASEPCQRGAATACAALLLVVLAAWPAAAVRAQPREDNAALLAEWAVDDGISLEIDTKGFELPTSIAMVPNPGSGPKDPLYFVTELPGTIKVVTNDRSIYVFAKGFVPLDDAPRPAQGKRIEELGMAGIHLDPEHGYVFVSFTYHSDRGGIRNNVIRFQSTPGTFSLKPQGSVAFTEIFADQIGDPSHMIGPMIVHEGALYVHVGDAHAPALARDLTSTAGKILRMTLDGKPLPDNPYYADDDIKKARNFVWARGLRNPFGVSIVRGEYFITDVGPALDRFLRVVRGGDYGYDGTDWSVSSHADIVFAPSTSPVQLVYHPSDRGPLPPAMRDQFFVVTSGEQMDVGPSRFGGKALLRFRYDFDTHRVVDRPYEVMKYVGPGYMMPVGLGIGSDGLYIVIFNSRPFVQGYVMKLRFDRANPHPVVFGRAERLIDRHNCNGCHREVEPTVAPSLAPDKLVPRLATRLASEQYLAESRELDALDEEPFASFRTARREVREAQGDAKVRAWVKYRVMEPRFDSKTATMPKLGLSEEDALLIAMHFVPKRDHSLTARTRDFLAGLVPKIRQRHLIAALALGVALGGLGTGATVAVVGLVVRRRRHRGSEKRQVNRPAEAGTARES
ncbi:MAG: PQQ-dependent sugar dehydrogenase [Myxococcales bacterium]|nr:PQQ-dependent sugar dehydrogenase [Myxococcales bacterium]